METIKVRALQLGYHNNRRQRAGSIFEMSKENFHPPGKEPCFWVEPIEGFVVDQTDGKVVAKKKTKAKEE